ncbi:MAG: PIN domain-containing protein [Parvibaculaceae bacterium]
MPDDDFLIDALIPGDAAFEAKFKKLDSIKDDALVFLDANVLLLPYGLNAASLTDIKSVYKKLAEQKRLFVPAQAAREFAQWRSKKLGDLAKSLSDQSSSFKTPTVSIKFLEGDQSLKRIADISDQIEIQRKALTKEISSLVKRFRDDLDDPISEVYREVFKGAVRKLDGDASTLKAEMTRRYEQKIPPGYADAGKEDGGRGDYIIWKTILQEGAKTSRNAILVTGDEKKDWYVQAAGAFHPRPELLYEYWGATNGKTFHLIPLSELLRIFEARAPTVEQTQAAEAAARVSSAATDTDTLSQWNRLRGLYPESTRNSSKPEPAGMRETRGGLPNFPTNHLLMPGWQSYPRSTKEQIIGLQVEVHELGLLLEAAYNSAQKATSKEEQDELGARVRDLRALEFKKIRQLESALASAEKDARMRREL